MQMLAIDHPTTRSMLTSTSTCFTASSVTLKTAQGQSGAQSNNDSDLPLFDGHWDRISTGPQADVTVVPEGDAGATCQTVITALQRPAPSERSQWELRSCSGAL